MNSKKNNLYRKLLVSAFTVLFFSVSLLSQITFSWQSEFSYLKGKDAASLAAGWYQSSFDYSSWARGAAPFRYDNGAGGTVLDMQNNYTTLYLKGEFNCQNSALIKSVIFSVDYDDGFIIWVNGQVAAASLAPASPAYNSLATGNHESGTAENISVDAKSLNLTDGINHIAVQGFNVTSGSSDFYFDLSISAVTDQPVYPASDSVVFSVNGGFYTSGFPLQMVSTDPSASIVYTLDGSNPQTSLTSFTAASPVSITVDPVSSAGRPVTPAFIVRASLIKAGYKASLPVTQSYIFRERVKSQSYPGGGWPSSSVNGQVIDLDVDTRVVNSPDYIAQFDASLTDIPTLSVVTDLRNLFDPGWGIYVNAGGHGLSWERDCSVELINPGGEPGFNVNAGLRIRGGWSRHSDFPKHSFRLFFREEYGNDKLNFPLFGAEGAPRFDKIDLRTEQNYAWANASPNNSLVRDVFTRDIQGAMGQPYSRSRAYHLYLNGMYWGIYQTQERTEARFAESYLGGDNDDYDVVKVNVENWSYSIEATDGNLDSWQRLWNLCLDGFSSNYSYFALEGKDQNGKPVQDGEIMVDIDNLIDYMLVIFYSGNFDAPTSSFMSNKGSNNFYAIDDRTDKSKGFTFYIHDSEHAVFDEAHSPGVGLYEDRVNIGTRTDNMRMEVGSFSIFHPQWLHFKLSANGEYRMRFADRALKAFAQGGVLSPEKGLELINRRIEEVDKAVIAESARWGDARRGSSLPYTRNNNWLPEVNKIRNAFLPYRSSIVVNQLKSAGLYPDTDPPVFYAGGSLVKDSEINTSSDIAVEIRNPSGSGIIYYTLDGSDPRMIGGNASPGAVVSLNDVTVQLRQTTIITSRVSRNGKWSPVATLTINDSRENYSGLKVTELNYHPADFIQGTDTTQGKDLEYIELKNTGPGAINLSALRIDSAIHYSFTDGDIIPPGGFRVLASKPGKFFTYYGMSASGNFSGNFSNGGEEILVEDTTGREIIRFRYSDQSPWPEEADGEGYTLASALKNPTGDPSDHTYWVRSSKKDGTPFADNLPDDPVDPEPDDNIILSAYPNPTSGKILLELKNDDPALSMQVAVYNLYGLKVASGFTGNPGEFDFSRFNIQKGIYILEVKTSQTTSRIKVTYLPD